MNEMRKREWLPTAEANSSPFSPASARHQGRDARCPAPQQRTGGWLFRNLQPEHRSGGNLGERRLLSRASPMLGAQQQAFSALGKLIGAPARRRGRVVDRLRAGRFWSNQALLVALLPCLMACGESSEKNTSELRAAVDAVCRTVAQCAETTFDIEEMKECRQVAAMLGLVLPDPESFAECMRSMDCEDLLAMEDSPSDIYPCVDLDPTSVRCEGDHLLACTNAGYCSNRDCEEACAVVGAKLDSCGEAEGYAYEVCRCRL